MGGGNSRFAHPHDSGETDSSGEKIVCSSIHSSEMNISEIVKIPKSDDICYLILKALKGKFIFESLNKNQLNDVIDVFVPVQCNAGEIIIQQGTRGDYMYVVEEGLFEITKDGVEGKVGECGQGGIFGELALLYNAERAATITCIEAASLWRLDRRSFKCFHTSNVKRSSQFILDILSHIPLFKDFNYFELVRIAEVARSELYKEGDVIIKKGDIGHTFYIVLEGIVLCCDEELSSSTRHFSSDGYRLKAGDWFGEIALLSSTSVRTANVVSESPLQLLAFDRDAFENILGNLKDILEKHSNERMLSCLPIITKLPQKKREHAVNMFSIEKFNKGETIAYCGDINPKLIVIKSGEACVWYHPDHPRHRFRQTDSIDQSSCEMSNHRLSFVSMDEVNSPDKMSSVLTDQPPVQRDRKNARFSVDSRFNEMITKIVVSSDTTPRVSPVPSIDQNEMSETKLSEELEEETLKQSNDSKTEKQDEEKEEIRQIEAASKREYTAVKHAAEEGGGGDNSVHRPMPIPRLERCIEVYEDSMSSYEMAPMVQDKFLGSEMENREAKWRQSIRHSLISSEQQMSTLSAPKELENEEDEDLENIDNLAVPVSLTLVASNTGDDLEPKGSIDTTQTEYEEILEGGDYIGDGPFENGTPMNCTMIAKTDVTCYVLAQTDVIRLLFEKEVSETESEDSDISQFMFSNRKSSSGKSYVEEPEKMKKKINWDNLMKLYELGSGGFGKVYLMQDQMDKAVYALKLIDLTGKDNIHSQELRILNEVGILKQMNSPYVCKLHACAMSGQKHYMLLEFIAGGEFSNLILSRDHEKRRQQRHDIAQGKLAGMPHQAAKFYIAAISLPLVYLHRRGIAYRDLKPGNIMIDRFGYPKLVDFGLSKRIDAIGKTFTLCGTVEFMAPEIILGDGHNQAVDWWALGVLLHEMIVGATPFLKRGVPRKQHEQMEIFERVVKGRVNFPEDMEEGCKLLIRRLLNNKPVYRMGCGRRGNLEFEEHEWFRGEVDWVSLNLRQMKPPWVPIFKANSEGSGSES